MSLCGYLLRWKSELREIVHLDRSVTGHKPCRLGPRSDAVHALVLCSGHGVHADLVGFESAHASAEIGGTFERHGAGSRIHHRGSN